jgi:uncharacterized protein
VAYEDDHVVLRHAGGTVARLTGGAVEAAPDPQIRPRWHVNFCVPDIEAAVQKATRLGGSVVPPVEGYDNGTGVTLRDPDGGLFTVTTRDRDDDRDNLTEQHNWVLGGEHFHPGPFFM